jgi:hypothetical protein
MGTAREAALADEQSGKDQTAHRQPNALTAFAIPKMDLVGPTVDDDIRRTIWRYGAEAVKKAVKEATKPKRGRRQEPDWPELLAIFKTDAAEWLAGRDPFALRSNYAIAKEIAERNPGQSAVSTHKRIERKLSAKVGGRHSWVLQIAWRESLNGHPFNAHIRTLEALAVSPDKADAQRWQQSRDRALSILADYEAREGNSPPAEMTFRQIEEAVRTGGISALTTTPPPRGLFGSRSQGQGLLGSLRVNDDSSTED